MHIQLHLVLGHIPFSKHPSLGLKAVAMLKLMGSIRWLWTILTFLIGTLCHQNLFPRISTPYSRSPERRQKLSMISWMHATFRTSIKELGRQGSYQVKVLGRLPSQGWQLPTTGLMQEEENFLMVPGPRFHASKIGLTWPCHHPLATLATKPTTKVHSTYKQHWTLLKRLQRHLPESTSRARNIKSRKNLKLVRKRHCKCINI